MYKNNRHIQNGAVGRFTYHPVVALLLFLALLLVSEIVSEPLSTYLSGLVQCWQGPLAQTTERVIAYLIIPFATPLAILFWGVTTVEKRSLWRLGFPKQKPLRAYLRGFALGTVLMSLYVLVGILFGAYSLDTIHLTRNISGLLLTSLTVLLGWILQGASEEILTRGWLLQSSAQKHVLTGIILSSTIFALLHLGNPGLNLLSLFNLVLYGLFASSYALYTENLWGICAFHSAWNWAQGNLFGIAVSGNATIGSSLLSIGSPKSSSLLTGGSFGAEGSLVVTVILSLGIGFLLYLTYKKERLNVSN